MTHPRTTVSTTLVSRSGRTRRQPSPPAQSTMNSGVSFSLHFQSLAHASPAPLDSSPVRCRFANLTSPCTKYCRSRTLYAARCSFLANGKGSRIVASRCNSCQLWLSTFFCGNPTNMASVDHPFTFVLGGCSSPLSPTTRKQCSKPRGVYCRKILPKRGHCRLYLAPLVPSTLELTAPQSSRSAPPRPRGWSRH